MWLKFRVRRPARLANPTLMTEIARALPTQVISHAGSFTSHETATGWFWQGTMDRVTHME